MVYVSVRGGIRYSIIRRHCSEIGDAVTRIENTSMVWSHKRLMLVEQRYKFTKRTWGKKRGTIHLGVYILNWSYLDLKSQVKSTKNKWDYMERFINGGRKSNQETGQEHSENSLCLSQSESGKMVYKHMYT